MAAQMKAIKPHFPVAQLITPYKQGIQVFLKDSGFSERGVINL